MASLRVRGLEVPDVEYSDDELPEPTLADLRRHRLCSAVAAHLTELSWRVAEATAPRARPGARARPRAPSGGS